MKKTANLPEVPSKQEKRSPKTFQEVIKTVEQITKLNEKAAVYALNKHEKDSTVGKSKNLQIMDTAVSLNDSFCEFVYWSESRRNTVNKYSLIIIKKRSLYSSARIIQKKIKNVDIHVFRRFKRLMFSIISLTKSQFYVAFTI